MSEPKWVWDGNLSIQEAFLEDCLVVLEGGEKHITRAHVAACADWALRVTQKAQRQEEALIVLQAAFARAAELAQSDDLHLQALSAKGPS